jgi:hypothetical protein
VQSNRKELTAVDGDVENQEPSYFACRKVNCTATSENRLAVS